MFSEIYSFYKLFYFLIKISDTRGRPLPVVWPSILREWFWRLKRAGTNTLPLCVEVVSIPPGWMPFRRSEVDRRFKIMMHFLLPSPEALAAPDGNMDEVSNVSYMIILWKRFLPVFRLIPDTFDFFPAL